MDSIHDAIQDANDVDEALREGFGNMPLPAGHIDDAALEEELNSIMAEEDKAKKRERMLDLPTVPTEEIPDADFARRLKRLREAAPE